MDTVKRSNEFGLFLLRYSATKSQLSCRYEHLCMQVDYVVPAYNCFTNVTKQYN